MILIVALVVGLTNLADVHATSEAVARTYSVEVALQQLLTTILDAEAGERGFIITNVPSSLEPYNGARETIAVALLRVRTLTADSYEQQTDLKRLSAVIEVELHELAGAIRRRQDSGFSAVQHLVELHGGSVTAQSEGVGQGSTFVIELPLAREA